MNLNERKISRKYIIFLIFVFSLFIYKAVQVLFLIDDLIKAPIRMIVAGNVYILSN